MIGIFLQVRMRSTRLPGKALLTLPGGNVIRHAMRALKLVKADVYALLTDAYSVPFLEEYALAEGFALFPGPEEDVLARYCLAARHFQVKTVVRATGDNPLVSPYLAAEIIREHSLAQADLSHFLGNPIGSGVEVVEYQALNTALEQSSDPYEREHITTYLYRHRTQYTVCEIPCPVSCLLPEVRITLDTEPDFERITALFQDLYRGVPIETTEIIEWYKTGRGRSFCRENV